MALFSNSSEILFGSLLLYHFRLLERQWGSRKYAAFAFVSSAISTGLALSALYIGRAAGLVRVASGPYGLIFAALYQYHRDVPVTVRVRILGVGLSDKVFLYILSAQLLWSSFFGSLTAGACGLLAGALYKSWPALRRWRFPTWLSGACHTYIEPLLASTPTGFAGVRTLGATAAAGAAVPLPDTGRFRNAGGVRRRAGGAPPAPLPPDEDAIAALQALGFEREGAAAALRATGNN
ncbi:hypothetical protein HK405_001424, partial [Cladochytrium tenue]